MTLRVVGAGCGRTGTKSLQLALEKLLGRRCYHMTEVFGRPDDIPVWHRAARGEPVDWETFLAEFAASVDWPGAAFWPELVRAFPDALVVLSVRDPEAWWQSASQTIFPVIRALPEGGPPFMDAWHRMVGDLLRERFGADLDDAASSMAAFERHNERVRAEVPGERLLEWRAGDGWEPLCAALELPVPDEPFPRVNTREEWRARRGSGSR